MKLVNVNVDWMQVLVTINKDGMKTNADVNDKETWDKGFLWSPSNCECECDESCDVGEYLDYENCKCRKRLIDKLVEECNENIDRKEMIYNETLNENICNSCRMYLYYLSYFNNKPKH